MTGRTFTPAQANRALPLVKSIVADILDRARELRGLADLSKDPESDPDVAAGRTEIRTLVEELESLGCTFKDPGFEIGLVDFPAEIEGEAVLLCWRGDEERITHYHAMDEGFPGRRPIPKELLEEGDPS